MLQKYFNKCCDILVMFSSLLCQKRSQTSFKKKQKKRDKDIRNLDVETNDIIKLSILYSGAFMYYKHKNLHVDLFYFLSKCLHGSYVTYSLFSNLRWQI